MSLRNSGRGTLVSPRNLDLGTSLCMTVEMEDTRSTNIELLFNMFMFVFFPFTTYKCLVSVFFANFKIIGCSRDVHAQKL